MDLKMDLKDRTEETTQVKESDHDVKESDHDIKEESEDGHGRREGNFGEEFAKLLSNEGPHMFGDLMKKLGIDSKMVEDATHVFKTVTESFSDHLDRHLDHHLEKHPDHIPQKSEDCCVAESDHCEDCDDCEDDGEESDHCDEECDEECPECSRCPMTGLVGEYKECHEDCKEECVNAHEENHSEEEGKCSHLECTILGLLESATEKERNEALEYMKSYFKPRFPINNLNVTYAKNHRESKEGKEGRGYRVRLVFDMPRLEAVHHLVEYLSL